MYWIFRHGVFHLDLKLNNFMVASDNRRVVLVDFGCARHETGLRRLGQQGLLQPQVFEKNFDLIWNEATTAVGADHGLEGNLTHRAPEVIASLNALASLPSNRHRGQNANTADDPDAAWVSLVRICSPRRCCVVILRRRLMTPTLYILFLIMLLLLVRSFPGHAAELCVWGPLARNCVRDASCSRLSTRRRCRCNVPHVREVSSQSNTGPFSTRAAGAV